MVNRGPSKGCRECRARKLKLQCDGEKPQCQRCNKSKIKCTGYDDFRERRELVWKGHAGRKKRSKPTTSPPILIDHQNGFVYETSKSPPLLGLPQDLEQQAISFYFINIHPRLRGYWHEDLDLFLRSERPSSMLSVAVSALSCIFISYHPQHSHFEQVAIGRYAELLRLVRDAVNSPEIVLSDNFLMIVCLMGAWEHVRSLSFLPSAKVAHLEGAMAIVKLRSKHSFQSPVARLLLMQIRAEAVYHSVDILDPDLSDEFLRYTDECLSLGSTSAIPTAYPDFFTLPDAVCGIARLLQRQRKVCTGTPEDLDLVAKASSLLRDAKLEYKELSKWPFQQPNRRPSQSYSLRATGCQKDGPYCQFCPKRVDVYCDTTQANMCNSWRGAQVYVLLIIAGAAAFLETSSFCQADRACLVTELESAEHCIRDLVDDLCSSIPYITSPKGIDKIIAGSPYKDLKTYIATEFDPEGIAGMSQLKKTLEVGLQAYCVPSGQRQCMQQYLKLLSSDRGTALTAFKNHKGWNWLLDWDWSSRPISAHSVTSQPLQG